MDKSKIFGDEYKRKFCKSCKTYEATPVYIIQTQKPIIGDVHILDSDDWNHFKIGLDLGGGIAALCGYNGKGLPGNAETLISINKRPLRFVTCEKCLKILEGKDGKKDPEWCSFILMNDGEPYVTLKDAEIKITQLEDAIDKLIEEWAIKHGGVLLINTYAARKVDEFLKDLEELKSIGGM